ncbi:MAG: hypothetical protein ABIY55_31665 [Kofleriaceae bacterium]
MAVIIGLGAMGAMGSSCAVDEVPPGTRTIERSSSQAPTSDFVCQCPNEPIVAGPEAQSQVQAQIVGPCQNVCGVCGDGVCNANESPSNCAVDCPTSACGNGICESGESSSSCPSDCGPPPTVCGNGVCESGESAATCATDCGLHHLCGNGICDAGEHTSCPLDCGGCVVFPCPNEPIASPEAE